MLGGHSFGGRVAFEMTRVLERMGQKVECLVLLDCSAPRLDEHRHDWDETTLLIAFAGALGLDISGDFGMLSGIVADQELDHKLARIWHELKQHNIVLPDTSITRVKGLFPGLQCQQPDGICPRKGPLTPPSPCFKASEFQAKVIDDEHFRQVIDDPTRPRPESEVMNRARRAQFNAGVAKTREDAHRGWDRYTTATVIAYDVPGDHMNLVRAPHVSALARVLRTCLMG